MKAWKALFFFLSLLLLLSAPLSAQAESSAEDKEPEIRRFEQRCDDEQHIWCLQQADAFLQASPPLSAAFRERITLKWIHATLALGREKEARRIILRLLREDPCRSLPSGLSGPGRDLFRSLRTSFLRQDTTPPILSLLLVSPNDFIQKRLLSAQVTDDRKVRKVILFFKTPAFRDFQTRVFQKKQADLYEIEIPKHLLQNAASLAYYIEAFDCSGNKSQEGDSLKPRRLPLKAEGSSGRTIGGGILLGISAALLTSAGLLFYAVGDDQERWNSLFNLEQAEVIRQRMILNYGLAWGGIGLGLLLGGVGLVVLLLPTKPAPSAPPSPPPSASSLLLQEIQ